MRICPACQAHDVAATWHCASCGHTPRFEAGIPLLAPDLAAGGGEDADYHHEALAAAEASHFWFVGRRVLLAEVIGRSFPRASSMLDVGCGTGSVAAGLRAARPSLTVVAGDVLLAGLRIGQQRAPAVEFVQFDIRALPYRAEFDVVGAFDVIEHVDDDRGVLKQMYEAARPGGGVVITVPQHQWLWSASDAFSHHRRRYSQRELRDKLTGAGFVVERMTSFMSALLPAMVVSRWRDQRVECYDPVRELRIGDGLNALCAAVCGIERAAISAGLSLPAGGSLLAVGRRA